MATPSPPIDMGLLVARLECAPLRFSDALDLNSREWCARASLKDRGIKLRGDNSAIQALIEYEVRNRLVLARRLDVDIDIVLTTPASGRPSGYSTVRDFLIFTHYRIEHTKLGAADNPRLVREARKATARLFALTCDTATVRSRRFSVEQVRRAEERILQRFSLIHHLDHGQLLAAGLLWGLQILSDYRAEARGGEIDVARFEANAGKLSLLCRSLDALQHADRLEKADARNARGLTERKLH